MSRRAATQSTRPRHVAHRSRLAGALTLLAISAAAAALVAPAARGQVLAWEAMNASLAVPELYVVRQSLPNSCGPAAVATLATWLSPGLPPLSEEAVLVRAALTADGISLSEFARLASLHGVPGTWFRVDHSSLARLATPFAAHLTRGGQGHFVIVLHVKGQLALIADPAEGGHVSPLSALTPEFTGLVFLVGRGA